MGHNSWWAWKYGLILSVLLMIPGFISISRTFARSHRAYHPFRIVPTPTESLS